MSYTVRLSDPEAADEHAALMRQVRDYKARNPRVLIYRPEECPSGKWEVSFLAASTMAFDNPKTMLEALSMVTLPPDDDS